MINSAAPLGSSALAKTNHTDKERSEMMEKSRWFRGFSWEEIQSLSKYLGCYKLNKDGVVFQEGAREAFLCLIVEGQVDILKESSSNRKKLIASIGPGKTLGEMSLIDGEPRSASAIASIDSAMLVLTKESYGRLTNDAPRLAVKLLTLLAALVSQRLRQTSGKLVDFLEQ